MRDKLSVLKLEVYLIQMLRYGGYAVRIPYGKNCSSQVLGSQAQVVYTPIGIKNQFRLRNLPALHAM